MLYLRGEFYERQKMYDQAEAEFRKALAIDPQNAAVLNYLGYMLADQGEKLPEALKMIQRGGGSGAAELRVSGLAGLGVLQDRPVSRRRKRICARRSSG